MAAVIAREVKNPLAGIRGACGVFERGTIGRSALQVLYEMRS